MQTGPGANLFLSKEDKFNIKMANTTITMLEMLKCTEIVNLASNNIIFTPETLRYFERNNIEKFSYEKLLWLTARSNMSVKLEESLGIKDFIVPITVGALGPVVGPAGAAIAAKHIARNYDAGKIFIS